MGQQEIRRSWPRWTGTVLRVCLSVGLVALLLWRVDIREAAACARGAKPGYLALAAVLMFALLAVCSTRWWLLLRARGTRSGWRGLFRIFLASNALNSVLPTALGGDALRAIWSAKLVKGRGTSSESGEEKTDRRQHDENGGKTEIGAAQAVSAVLVDRSLGLLALLALSAFGALALPAGNRGFLVVNAVTFGLAMLGVLVVFFGPAYQAVCAGIGRVKVMQAGSRIVALLSSLREYRRPLWLLVVGFALSAGVWVLHCSVWYALALGVGSRTPAGYFLALVPLVALATMLPISIGGAGVRENGFALVMAQAGMSTAQATAIALLFFLVTCLYALIGAVVLAGLKRSAQAGTGPAAS